MNDKYVEEKARELCEQNYVNKEAEDFIRTIVEECKVRVSREWVYYFCAYINAGHKSSADDKARVEHAIKKLKEAGVEVTDE